MEIKKHFKLYKSGKQWVTAAVATVAVSTALLYGGVAHADQQVQQASTTQDQTSTVNNDTDKTVALDTNTDQSAQTTDKKQVVSNTNQSKTDDTSTADKNSTSIPVSVLPSNNTQKQAKNYMSKTKETMGILILLTLAIINCMFQDGMQRTHLKEQTVDKSLCVISQPIMN